MVNIFIFLSTLGLLDSLFLTQQHYNKNPFACPLFGGCDAVTNSAYSEIFGIPVSLLGVGYYLLILAISLYSHFKGNKKYLSYAAMLTVAGLITSAVLVYLQVYVLQAICFYCMVSATTSTLLFIAGYTYLKKANLIPFKIKGTDLAWGMARILLGFIFLWSFIEKVPVWMSGGSPAYGFLAKGTSGVFADFFQSLAGNPLVDLMYMFGMFAVGTALILGITKKLATVGGILMLVFIYLAASLPPAHNPIIDEHIIYILLLLILYNSNAYEKIGIYKKWIKIPQVKRLAFLN